MRIVGGQFKGRKLIQPKSRSVRPMGEKVRGAVFDIAGPLARSVVLDAYAGSGAVGLEALSRGARLVEAIESDRKTAQIIEQNSLSLNVGEQYQLWVTRIETWLQNQAPQSRYDLIVADPPYAKIDAGVLDQLAGLIKAGGLMIVSHSSKIPSPALKSLSLDDRKDYGDSSLSIYR